MFDTDELQRGIRAYLVFAEANLEQISAINAAAYAQEPAFAPMLKALSGEAMLAQNRANIVKLAAGALDGNWQPYVTSLRERGTAYARAGIGFDAWTRAFRLLLGRLIDLEFERVADREQLRLMIKATAELFDVIVEEVGKTFFEAQRSSLAEKDSAIRALATPILRAYERVLLVPLIGAVDDTRMQELHGKLLSAVRAERARGVVIDVTGVANIDSSSVALLTKIARSAAFMGARVVVCGLAPDVCRALVTLGAEMPGADTVATLEEALRSVRPRD